MSPPLDVKSVSSTPKMVVYLPTSHRLRLLFHSGHRREESKRRFLSIPYDCCSSPPVHYNENFLTAHRCLFCEHPLMFIDYCLQWMWSPPISVNSRSITTLHGSKCSFQQFVIYMELLLQVPIHIYKWASAHPLSLPPGCCFFLDWRTVVCQWT